MTRVPGALIVAVVVASCDSGTAPLVPPAVTRVSPDRGPLAGGTNVAITGTNFTDITGVTLGGVALTGMTVVSATTITGTTAPGAVTGVQEVVVTSDTRGSGRCAACFSYTQFPGPLMLRLSSAPADSAQPLGALLIRVDGGRLSAIVASGPTLAWTSSATTPAHLIVRGDLIPGMVLATISVPDTQEAVRHQYSASVRQATSRPWTGYRQLNGGAYTVSITVVGP